jgi:hypothetical protein
MVAGMHEQSHIAELQDQELACLQRGAEEARLSYNPLPTGDVYITVRWFDPDMIWAAKPSGKRGRQQTYSDCAIQTWLTVARQVIV